MSHRWEHVRYVQGMTKRPVKLQQKKPGPEGQGRMEREGTTGRELTSWTTLNFSFSFSSKREESPARF